jgi:hypothetical protein
MIIGNGRECFCSDNVACFVTALLWWRICCSLLVELLRWATHAIELFQGEPAHLGHDKSQIRYLSKLFRYRTISLHCHLDSYTVHQKLASAKLAIVETQ